MSRPPRWTRALLRILAPADRVDEVLGDLEEVHRRRTARGGRWRGTVLTAVEAMDMAVALLRERGGVRSSLSLLDFKLGLRMLVRYPGLTLVGGLAMAFAIWAGAVSFEIVGQMASPELPLDDGDRIVGFRNVDLETGRATLPSLEDFAAWRGELETVTELGAFRIAPRNLLVGGTAGEPVEVVEITASGFGVARVPPLLGRTLNRADEEPGAPPVVVIGHDVWRSRFAGDPGIVGRTVGVGNTRSTVVGVMPRGFAFPLAHDIWVPLRRPPPDLDPGGGGPVAVFGRLAGGASMDDARAELEVVGARRASAFPEALGRVRTRPLPYALSVRPLPDIGPAGLAAINVFMVMLVVLVCGNVALLMFARAATRESELAVRSALGAGRARIVGQLFVEALVLGGLAAVVGLLAAELGVGWVLEMQRADTGGRVPFWVREGLAPATVLYLLALTLVASAVAGVLPALRVTGTDLESRLRRASAGATGLRISGVWSAVLVIQVAVTVAFPATAFFFQRYVDGLRSLDLGLASEEYLAVRLEIDAPPGELPGDRLTPAYLELAERLAGDPGVAAVTSADLLPGAAHPLPRVEIEAHTSGPAGPTLYRAARAEVEVGYFESLGAPVRAGRDFDADDPGLDPGVVIVNETFAEEILGGRNPVGRRVRYAASPDREAGPWFGIVGVARDLGVVGGDLDLRAQPAIYHPVAPGAARPLRMAVHVRGDPDAFAARLRAVAAAVGPELRLHDVRRLDRVSESRWRESEFLARLLAGVSLVALVLSLTTIYSVMSFTVSRRTREIGVRVALGASRGRIVGAVFRRPLVRVAAGVVVGMLLVALVTRAGAGALTYREIVMVAVYATAMLAVCLTACVVPTLRALGVEPTEALRAEG